jgi:ribonuclease HI
MPDLLVYTDGACLGNPGPGGWGVRILYPDGTVRELGGREASTTNNRMELQGALAALQAIEAGASAIVYSDSQYVINGLTKWLSGWKRKGWMNAARKPVKNRDLWMQLDAEDPERVAWRHVHGHSGDPGNDRADEIARGFAAGEPPDLVDSRSAPDAGPVAANSRTVQYVTLLAGALILDTDPETHRRRRQGRPQVQARVRTLRELADFCARHGLELPPDR